MHEIACSRASPLNSGVFISEHKKTSEDIDRDRRRFVETAAVGIAAAGSFGLLPKGTAAAAEGDAIRPFRVNVPEEQLVDLRRRINATKWPERETVNDETQGCSDDKVLLP
jgi:Epoxide hydrolase N terminus